MHALLALLKSPFARQLLVFGLEWGLRKANRSLLGKKERDGTKYLTKAYKKAAKASRKARKKARKAARRDDW